jgi:hypothetical protein
MLMDQTSELLTVLAAVDNREVTEFTIGAWHEVIGHLDYSIARAAVIAARQNTTISYVEPRHVLAHAETLHSQRERQQRIAAAGQERIYKTSPKPANFEALAAAAASGDPIALAREKAVYNQQLIDGGYAPLYEVGEAR